MLCCYRLAVNSDVQCKVHTSEFVLFSSWQVILEALFNEAHGGLLRWPEVRNLLSVTIKRCILMSSGKGG